MKEYQIFKNGKFRKKYLCGYEALSALEIVSEIDTDNEYTLKIVKENYKKDDSIPPTN